MVVGVATNADVTDHRAEQPSRASFGTAAQLSSTLPLVADARPAGNKFAPTSEQKA